MRKKHFNPSRRNINREIMEVIADKALNRIEELEREVEYFRQESIPTIDFNQLGQKEFIHFKKKMKKKGKKK